MTPRCRTIIFDSREEAMAAAKQEADATGGVIVARDWYITVKECKWVTLTARWKL
jgi:hypothetical protein